MPLIRMVAVACVVALAFVAALALPLRSARESEAAPTQAEEAAVQRRLQELAADAARLEEMQRRKSELEAQLRALEPGRSGAVARALRAFDESGRPLCIALRQIQWEGDRLQVTFDAPSADVAARFVGGLESRGVLTRPSLEPRGGKAFVLDAVVGVAPASAGR